MKDKDSKKEAKNGTFDKQTIEEAEENLKKKNKKKLNYLSLMPLEVTKILHI